MKFVQRAKNATKHIIPIQREEDLALNSSTQKTSYTKPLSQQSMLNLQRTVGNQAVQRLVTQQVPLGTVQRKGWTWNGNRWIPDSGAAMPQPPVAGSAVGARYVTMDAETADDVVSDCPNNPINDRTYNRGRDYAVQAFNFQGERAHSSNRLSRNPRSRLQDMADAGATATQLREVMRLWGIG